MFYNWSSDIGAGDGEVTMQLVKGLVHMKNNIFLKVFATEHSWTMRERLQEKQFMYVHYLCIIHIHFGAHNEKMYLFIDDRLTNVHYSVIDKLEEVENIDLICCLNVLDRCADPYLILSEIHRALASDGRAVIALVLPYTHYVETSKTIHLSIYLFSRKFSIENILW